MYIDMHVHVHLHIHIHIHIHIRIHIYIHIHIHNGYLYLLWKCLQAERWGGYNWDETSDEDSPLPNIAPNPPVALLTPAPSPHILDWAKIPSVHLLNSYPAPHIPHPPLARLPQTFTYLTARCRNYARGIPCADESIDYRTGNCRYVHDSRYAVYSDACEKFDSDSL